MFKIGEMAVYPAYGVGVIEAIETKKIFDNEEIFYILRLFNNNITIMIPADNITSVGLRRIINNDSIPKIYEILKVKNIEKGSYSWNKRYKWYMEKIKAGSLFDIAEVLRDLYLLKEDKDLSFGEKKIMDLAYNLLVKELSIASNLSQDIIERDISNIFNC